VKLTPAKKKPLVNQRFLCRGKEGELIAWIPLEKKKDSETYRIGKKMGMQKEKTSLIEGKRTFLVK